jgi:dolichyl-phosphate beta-glucosyltransferase
MKPPALSIIIPAYQEAGRIESSLDELAAYLDSNHDSDTEVLVVVADSPDGTTALAAAKAKYFKRFRLIAAGPKVGKGYQVRMGMMEAKGAYKLFMDADLATPLHYIDQVRALTRDKPEVIIAMRDLANSHIGLRKLVSSFGNWLVQAVLLPGISDTQCGFKAFSAEAADALFRRQTIMGWGFDMEILAVAHILKYRIVTIPVPDWHDHPEGTIGDNITSAAVQTLGELGMILLRKWTGRYRHPTFTYKPLKP